MNPLANALDTMADRICEVACKADGATVSLDRQDVLDVVELMRVLRRMVKGTPAAKAFGAPGDWGYNHPIGKALVAHLTGQTEEPR